MGNEHYNQSDYGANLTMDFGYILILGHDANNMQKNTKIQRN